mmetsp:Transcript_20731/g.31196  ORF Transcript_20731/g.31196 Transcript_20731/m.31196 type:complete len:210 (+) Transcript_20731:235-864(+)
MHHSTSNTKHSSTSVLDFNVQLAVTLFRVFDLSGEWVSSWDSSRRSIETSWKVLWSSGVLGSWHSNKLGNTSEKSNLHKSKSRNVGKSRETHTILQDISEWVVTSKVKGSWESNTKLLNHHTNESSHGNTSVLDLNSTTTREGVNIVNVSKRIEKVQWTRVYAKAVRRASISIQGSGGTLGRSWSESSSGGEKGSGNSELHCDKFLSKC